MEGRDAGGPHKGSGARTRHELTFEVWVSLGRAAVGENELPEIQRAIAKRFGEGAELRHPEIIEFDARWRQAQIEKSAADSSVFDRVDPLKPLRPKQAEALIKKLEKLRKKFERAGDVQAMRGLQDEAANARQA